MQKIRNVSCTDFWYYLKNLISGPYLAHFSPKTSKSFFPKKTFPSILSLYAAKKSFRSILRSYASATWRNLILAWKPQNKIFSKVKKIEVIIRYYAAVTYAKNQKNSYFLFGPSPPPPPPPPHTHTPHHHQPPKKKRKKNRFFYKNGTLSVFKLDDTLTLCKKNPENCYEQFHRKTMDKRINKQMDNCMQGIS